MSIDMLVHVAKKVKERDLNLFAVSTNSKVAQICQLEGKSGD